MDKKSKAEERKRQQICEVLDLCLQINGLQSSEQELTGDHPTAFFYFSGHTARIKIDVHRDGWKAGAFADDCLDAFTTEPGEVERLIRRLKQLKKDLHSGNCNRSDKQK